MEMRKFQPQKKTSALPLGNRIPQKSICQLPIFVSFPIIVSIPIIRTVHN